MAGGGLLMRILRQGGRKRERGGGGRKDGVEVNKRARIDIFVKVKKKIFYYF